MNELVFYYGDIYGESYNNSNQNILPEQEDLEALCEDTDTDEVKTNRASGTNLIVTVLAILILAILFGLI